MKHLGLVALSELRNDMTTKKNEVFDQLLPVGIPYKKFLDSHNPKLKNYILVVNVADELDIHFIINNSLGLSNSQVYKDLSLEALIEGSELSELVISKILDLQLKFIFDVHEKATKDLGITFSNIIYLENTTNYMAYYSKVDSILVSDPLWKSYELKALEEMSKD